VFPELLRGRLEGIVHLSPSQLDQLQSHYELLVRWNRSLNLTSIDTLEEAVERHYCESLFLGKHVTGGRIADIGSGAGFPGIPVAILRPDTQVTLIESHQRKAVFLKEATRSMPNARVMAKRAEAVAERESFDWVISRAVNLQSLTGVLPRLAPRAALLTGPDTPTAGLPYQIEAQIALPWRKAASLLLCFT
jgi:16S rRNA (guanine527-N7)-methyltransferase